MYDWFDHPIDRRARKGGEVGVDGKLRKGGEYLPFYVPRAEMPQIDEKDYPALFEFVAEKGISYELRTFSPADLRAHQRVVFDRIVNIDEFTFKKPILVSKDGYVLDGNHRWKAHAIRGINLDAYVLGLEFEAAIELLFEFPKTYAYGDGNVHIEAA